MSNSTHSNSNAHMVLATLTDEAASGQLHQLDTDVINDIIKLVGGEEAFAETYEKANKNGVDGAFEALSVSKAVADVYHDHKPEILAFCRKAADCVGKGSTTELIAAELGGDANDWLDEIGEALHTERESLDITHSKAGIILTCVVGIVISELCAVFAEMQVGYED